MIVFITKYALTQGILEIEPKQTHSVNMIGDVNNQYTYYHKPDWHLTKEEAIIRAEEMRIKKLQSLDKQIKRISALKF